MTQILDYYNRKRCDFKKKRKKDKDEWILYGLLGVDDDYISHTLVN